MRQEFKVKTLVTKLKYSEKCSNYRKCARKSRREISVCMIRVWTRLRHRIVRMFFQIEIPWNLPFCVPHISPCRAYSVHHIATCLTNEWDEDWHSYRSRYFRQILSNVSRTRVHWHCWPIFAVFRHSTRSWRASLQPLKSGRMIAFWQWTTISKLKKRTGDDSIVARVESTFYSLPIQIAAKAKYKKINKFA